MKARTLGYSRAIEAMRKPETRLVRMNNGQTGGGFAFYVIPGGRVEDLVADKIINHPLVRAGHDGLFPGHNQTWKMIADRPEGEP
jgi:hypothetical protein